MRVVLIIQARMKSTRLPGKVMRKVCGESLLEILIRRVKNPAWKIVVATPTGEENKIIWNLCKKMRIPVFKGSEDDVLERYYEAAKKYKADVVIRVTSDCPLINDAIIHKVLANFFLATSRNISSEQLFVSNIEVRTFPKGMDVEIFTFRTLEDAHLAALKPYNREHVTPFMRKIAKVRNVPYGEYYPEADYSRYRLTVDTLKDFLLIKKIIEELYPTNYKFQLEDVLMLLENNKNLRKKIEVSNG